MTLGYDTRLERVETSVDQSNIVDNDHIWPMYKHDAQRTGRSPYDTSDNTGFEKWKYFIEHSLTSTPVIDKNGTLYVASNIYEFHSVFPDGTRNWRQEMIGFEGYDPAIGNDGTIYVGTNERFHAFYPNGTLRWILDEEKVFLGYPVVSPEDIIYVGTRDGYLYAIYPNGTIKWEYKINDVIRAPALDKEGNIYFTTYYDNNLFCLNPNGTLKWTFKSTQGFRNGPVIDDDGTIYLSPTSQDVLAVNPDGSEKWITRLENGGGSIPAIAPDGTLIISGEIDYVNALDPKDGKVLWTYTVETDTYDQTSAVIGAEGTIYFAYTEWYNRRIGYMCALEPDGTFKWKTRLTTDIYPYSGMDLSSDLSIGSDGTVYVTSWFSRGGSNYTNIGYLHAFGIVGLQAYANGPYYGLINEPVQFNGKGIGGYSPFNYHWDFGDGHTSDEQNPSHIYTYPSNFTVTLTVSDSEGNVTNDTTWAWVQDGNIPPDKPTIIGPVKGKPEEILYYDFVTSDPEGTQIWYFIDWDFGNNPGWLGPYKSGTKIEVNHWWPLGTFTIRCKAKDPYGDESPWGELEITIPRNKETSYSFFSQFLERFPLLKHLFSIYLL